MNVESFPDSSNQDSVYQEPTLVSKAEETLRGFYGLLAEGDYEQAAILFGGSYEILQEYNPNLENDDYAGLLEAGCESNGFMCLEILDIISIQTSDAHVFFFEIALANPDGTQFVLGPCCGETEETMPPQSTFMVAVTCQDDNTCLAMDLPPYLP